jgi:hypothetical protein
MYIESLNLVGRARHVVAALASVLGVLVLAGTTHGTGHYPTVEYPPSTAANELQVGVTDTPWIPEYVVASAKPDLEHTDAVITLNSVELKSEPSVQATPQKELGAKGLVPFDGEKSSWHGFDRYDFLMDETNLTIKPYKVAPDEKNAIKAQVKGHRRCVVVVPKAAASGNPWSWQGCYWDHEPQAEVELLKRGFHIAFAAPDAGAQGKVWDTWYKFLTEKHGLAKKAAFIGMSKGGVNEFNWGVVNPDKVACVYADNTALYDEDFAKIPALAQHDVPLLHICGSEDFLLQRHTRVVEDRYHHLGGLITVIVKEGHAHHPHSLQNAKLIADWIEQHMTPSTANRPAFVDETFTKGYYYSLEPSFIYLKEEDTYGTARGPGFTECYDRYDGLASGRFKMGGISIIVPKTVAPGKPWVFTGDPIERDATVEQALLAKGYHILIVSPMGSGMTRKQWDDAYQLLVDHAFSKKPVLKGTGPKAGEAYAWAVANPHKVSCLYARNPLMQSLMAGKEHPIDNLAALAKAGVTVLHDCGALDPWLDSQTRVVEKRYKELDGKITVIVREGEGHFPLSPKDPKSVVDFIIKNDHTEAAQPKSTAIPVKGDAPIPNFDKNSPFYFDGTISHQTLEHYLDRAITMGYFLVPGQPEGYQFPYRDDDVRMIHNLGAKLIGRAIYRWGQESKLGDPAFLEYAKKMVVRVHAADPEVVFQGCLFEQVTTDVNKLKIPAWVFADFGLPVLDRTFSCAAIIKREGRPGRGGGRGGVPIINNLETRLWFYYLAVSYINIGCEAFHLGQVGLIGADDKDLKVYSEFLARVRAYAKLHARRHLVLLDGHVPSGGMVKDGVSLLDFNSFPMRIKAVPGKPHEAILEVGHLDAIFKRSKGCISPGGWRCDSLPYLVEFDNFGRGPKPNVADPKSIFCWGWDEISWFAQQPEEYRNQWLRYAHNWIKQTDPDGHLEMPGTRMISCPNETLRTYFANTKSPTCPVGYSQEETIKKIWNQGQSPAPAFEGEKTK